MPIRTRSTRSGGHRRCGVRHGQEWFIWPQDQFNEADLARLKSDPLLVLEELTEEPKKEREKKPGKAPKPDIEPKPDRAS